MKPNHFWRAMFLWHLLIWPAAAATYYVDINSPNPSPPYASLATAATSIQDAVDAATNGDLILVNDGDYNSGWRATPQTSGFPSTVYYTTNRVVITNLVTVQSLNGPSAAIIDGGGTNRCVDLGAGAVLSGFTLTNGKLGTLATNVSAQSITIITADGGGVSSPNINGRQTAGGTLSNCVLTANMASGYGGGAYWVTLVNCLLIGNQATNGGGAAYSTLINCQVISNSVPASGTTFTQGTGQGGGLFGCSAINCVLAGNSAFAGGGSFNGGRILNCTVCGNSAVFYGGLFDGSFTPEPVTNSIVYFNTATTNANYYTNVAFGYCCTFPQPAGGLENITNDPGFADASAGDYHLNPSSPMINSGLNAAITNATDLDGNPRIAGGTVDIGAYEFPNPTSVLSYAWAQQYGLPTDGSADYVDSDGTGMNNWQKFVAGLNPTNAASVLKLFGLGYATIYPDQFEIYVSWPSVINRTYALERSTNLLNPSGFTCIASNLPGTSGTAGYFDNTATKGGSYFYRIRVQ